MKKLTALLLALLMVVTMAPLGIFADDDLDPDPGGEVDQSVPEEQPIEEDPPLLQLADPPVANEEEPPIPAADEETPEPAPQADEPTAVYLLTVLFTYENGQTANAPFYAEYDDGSEYSVPVKTIQGYQATLDGSDDAVAAVTGTLSGADKTVTVVYKGDSVNYTVRHHVEMLKTPAGSETEISEIDEPKVGKVGNFTAAAANSAYTEGRTATAPKNVMIAGSGIVIDIYYTLNDHTVTYNSNGGTYVSPGYVKYGQNYSLTTTIPTKLGYTFAGWYTDSELKNGVRTSISITGDVTLYAKWTAKKVSYSVVYWKESVTTGSYDYYKTNNQTADTGSKVSGSGTERIDYFHYNADKTDKDIVIKGDGSSVVNVYYDRNIYTITFDLRSNSANLTIGGKTYGRTAYSFKAKLDEDISARWPMGSNISGNNTAFYGWYQYYSMGSYSGTAFVSKRINLTEQMIVNKNNGETTTYYARYQTGRNVELHYWLENAENNQYTDSPLYRQSAVTNADFDPKDIQGFTWKETTTEKNNKGQVVVYNFYYKRNTYTLDFSNGGKIDKSYDKIKFEASIASREYTPARPSNVPTYYVFGGWYKTADCLDDSKFSFTDAKMPPSNLVLYAKWAAPEFTVRYNSNGGTAVKSEGIIGGMTATRPTDPTKSDSAGDYKFMGWYTDTVLNNIYDFAKPVESDITLNAKWKLITVTSYTVKFLFEDDSIAAPQLGPYTADVGSTVYSSAQYVEGFIADANAKNLKLVADPSKNIIVYRYSTPKDIGYTVKYILEGATTPFKTESKTTSLSRLKVMNTTPYSGYYAMQSFAWLDLEKDETKNVVTFTYCPINYTVTYLNYDGTELQKFENKHTGDAIPNYSLTIPTKASDSTYRYTFLKFMLSSGTEGTGNNVGSTDLVYTARFDLAYIDYTVTYDYNMGDSVADKVFSKLHYNTDTPTVADPERAGFSFTGWLPKVAEKVTKSVTYVAQWSRNSYILRIKYWNEEKTEEVFPLYASPIDYEEQYSVASPPLQGFTADKPVVVGKMPASDLTVDVIYKANSGIKYMVEWYVPNANYSGYEVKKTDLLRTGTTGKDVKVTDADKILDGYTFDPDNNLNVLTAKINADGTTTLKLYFKKNLEITVYGNTASNMYDGKLHTALGWTSDAPFGVVSVIMNATVNAKAERTNFGKSMMGLKPEYFNAGSMFCEITKIKVVDGYSEITPRTVILTSDTDSKVYDRTPLTRPDVKTSGDGFVTGEVTGLKATGSITDVGTVDNSITFQKGEKYLDDNYTVTKKEGKLSISPITDKVIVTVTGHTDTVIYDGAVHNVTGYDLSDDNSHYDMTDISFTGKDTVSGKDVGTYHMGLTRNDFANINSNFTNVEFVVTDGFLKINPRTDLGYTVNYLEEGTNDPVAVAKTVDNMTQGSKIDETAVEAEGFTALDPTEQSLTISADEDNVINFYYSRNRYSVTYQYEGKIPVDASSLPAIAIYPFGAEVKIASDATAVGYHFTGWDKENFIMPAENVTITGSFVPNEDTAYSVEYYLENLDDDGFTLDHSDDLEGTTDEMVKAEIKSFMGFTYAPDTEGNMEEGRISGVEKLVLRLYYTRNRYTVRYVLDGGYQTDGNFEDVIFTGIKYGAATPGTEEPFRMGSATQTETITWSFDGWDPMTAETVTDDAVYTATWSFEIITVPTEAPVESPTPSPSDEPTPTPPVDPTPTVTPTEKPKETPSPSPAPVTPVEDNKQTPQTGDSSAADTVFPIFIGASLMTLGLVILRKRRLARNKSK